VLLGFELDPFNDSITSDELLIRQRRQQIEDELDTDKEDSFYRQQ